MDMDKGNKWSSCLSAGRCFKWFAEFSDSKIVIMLNRRNIYTLLLVLFTLFSGSCSSPKYLGRTNIPDRFIKNPAISDSHIGIAIYDPENREYLYEYNSEKFFIPASNTKLPTLYAGLRYVGNGIPGVQYIDYNDTIFLKATGDPAFLLNSYPDQPVLSFLQCAEKPLVFIEPPWETRALGYGWPWNFYLNYYMPERNPFPVYGNMIMWAQRDMEGLDDDVMITYIMSDPGHRWPVEIKGSDREKFEIARPVTENIYTIYPGLDGERNLFVPYVTDGMKSALELLQDTLRKEVGLVPARTDLPGRFNTVYSRASDSLFRPMMVYSDNFFAEQTLLMVSNHLLGVMNEELLIEYLLENDFSGMPDKPRWVDGSGLSRYNLFSPRSFVWLLEKMKDEFGFERISNLLPTGGEGTLNNLYNDEKGRIYAKTGTLGGNAVALSGYIITMQDRMLIFSVLVNNHNKESAGVRNAIQDFVREIVYRY